LPTKEAPRKSAPRKLFPETPEAPEAPEAKHAEKAKEKKPKKVRPPRFKNDPQYVAAARELRDRYIEQINSGGAPGSGLLLPPSACGKYDVSRALEHAPTVMNIKRDDGDDPGARLLDAA